LLALPLLLAACNNVKEELGVGRHSPDEFAVVKRAPLTLPPDYTLRPPEEGGITPASAVPMRTKAVLLGDASGSADAGEAEGLLLQKMGANNADPSIRSIINRENGFIALQSQSVADKLIFWENPAEARQNMPASVVDPAKEAERLEKNAEEGKPPNAGEVPVIEKKQGTIDKIF
jgi:hypothetical protein